MNNNNQGGNNNSTAFSAYNAQKNAAVTKAATNIATKIPGPVGTIAKAAKPMVNGAVNNIAAQAAASRVKAASEEGETQGEQQQNQPSPLDTGKAVAKESAKKAIKSTVKKFVIAHWPIFLIIGIGLLMLLFIVALVTYSYEEINQKTDKFISGYESGLNFITGNGADDNFTVAINKISEATKSYAGLDKGILIATLNDSALILPTLYDEDYAVETDNSEGNVFNAAKNFVANKYSIHSFYNMKRDMIGKGVGDAGSALNSIIGLDISVECVPKNKLSESQNARVLLEYAYDGLLAANDIFVTGITDNLENGFRTIWFGSIELSYKNQGSDFVWKETSEALNFIDNLPHNAIKNDWENLKEQANQCGLQYEKDANGNPITTKPLVAQYTSVEKTNDYQEYYNYIKKVYVPVVYMSTWSDLDNDGKAKLVNDVWGDIVRSRNDYYTGIGSDSELSYRFDSEGRLVATVTGTMLAGFSMGTVLTSEAALEALTWKQSDPRWGNDYIGSSTIGAVGCLATSVAKLIAISGTTILTDTFDPGFFVKTLKNHVPPGFSGNMFNGYGWETIAPNFTHPSYADLDDRSMTENAGSLSDYIKTAMANKGYAGPGWYYVILVNYTKANGSDGTHWIAIAGMNERGELLLSDPGNGKVYSIEEFAQNTGGYYRNPRLGGVSLYYASDVTGNSMSSIGG